MLWLTTLSDVQAAYVDYANTFWYGFSQNAFPSDYPPGGFPNWDALYLFSSTPDTCFNVNFAANYWITSFASNVTLQTAWSGPSNTSMCVLPDPNQAINPP